MDQRWFEDMMSQKYHEDICFNPSKIFLMSFLVADGVIKDFYKVRDFQEHLYRIYIDNPEVSSKHPSYLIRNISTYGVKDIEEHTLDTLESWCRDSKNSILKQNTKYIRLEVDLTDMEDIVKNTNRFSKMMYKRLFRGDKPEIRNIASNILKLDDQNIEEFGRCLYKNRVLEDLQYCPVCEEINVDKLYVVHLFEKRMGASEEQLVDKANGLVFCECHARQFISNGFYYDELGFVHDNGNSDVEPGMHLSFSIRSIQRKEYLKKRYQYLKDNGKLI